MGSLSVNSVIGIEGFFPLVLVYAATPQPDRMELAITQQQHSELMDDAMKS